MSKPKQLIIHHPESDSYFLGTAFDLKGGETLDVTGIAAHERQAALAGVINLPINPDVLSKSGTEHGEQTALVCWANYCAQWFPQLGRLFAIGNGGSRGDTEQSRKIAGGMMKAEGVKPGVPDLFLPVPRNVASMNAMYAGLFIELKRVGGGDGGSPDQLDWIAYLNEVGYAAQICNGWKDAARVIRLYLEI